MNENDKKEIIKEFKSDTAILIYRIFVIALGIVIGFDLFSVLIRILWVMPHLICDTVVGTALYFAWRWCDKNGKKFIW